VHVTNYKITKFKIQNSKLQESNFATLQIHRFPNYKSKIINFQVHNMHELTKKQEGILWIPHVYHSLNHKRQVHIYGALFGYCNLYPKTNPYLVEIYMGIATYILKPILIS
jgi:hypothetical protein